MTKRSLTPSEVEILKYKGRGRRPGAGLATRSKIIRAAMQIMRSQGTDKLSIDNVIAQSEVSKGAFLYHFPSRAKLIEAIAEEFACQLKEISEELEYEKSLTHEPVIAAYIKWYQNFKEGHLYEGFAPLIGLSVASRENLRYMDPIRAWYRNHFKKLEKTKLGFEDGLLATMALDALFFHKLIGIGALNDDEEEIVIRRVAKLAGLTEEDLKSENRPRVWFEPAEDAAQDEEPAVEDADGGK